MVVEAALSVAFLATELAGLLPSGSIFTSSSPYLFSSTFAALSASYTDCAALTSSVGLAAPAD